MFRDAKPLECLFHVRGDVIPAAFWFLAVGKIVPDVVETDVFQIAGRPMRRHGFVVEHLEGTLAEVAHPVGIVFDVADVVDGAFRQTVTGVVLVAFGKKEVAFAAINVAGGERGALVWMGGWVGFTLSLALLLSASRSLGLPISERDRDRRF